MTILLNLVLVWVSLFSLFSSMFLWSGTLFKWSFSSLFILLFLWLTLFLLLVDVLSCCVLLTLFSMQMLFNWLLLVWVLFIHVWFSISFGMLSRGSVTMCLSNTVVICVGFTFLVFLVISHPVFVTHIVYDLLFWLWSPFPTIVP